MDEQKSYCKKLNSALPSRILKVFISSTFKDFQEERDILRDEVFPAVRIEAKRRNVELIPIDLRTGLTDEESQLGGSVVVCLKEVERSRPHFISMLGERYGWVPKPTEIPNLSTLEPTLAEKINQWFQSGESVTAMEIRHGVLENKEEQPYAWFYFRDRSLTEDLASKVKNPETFFEVENLEKLNELKREILDEGREKKWHHRTYKKLKSDTDDYDTFRKQVKDDLLTALNKRFPIEQSPHVYPTDALHIKFAQNLIESYVPNEKFLKKIFQRVENFETVFLKGQFGSGKSSALAWLAKEFCRKNPEAFVFVYFVGIEMTELLEKHKNIVNHNVIESLQNSLGVEGDFSPYDLWNELHGPISEKKPCLVVIDNLEKLENFPEEAKKIRKFLDRHGYTQGNIKYISKDKKLRNLVGSSRKGRVSLLFSGQEPVPYLLKNLYHDIPSLSKKQIITIIKNIMEKYTKKLTTYQSKKITESFIGKTPFHLKVFLNLLLTEGRLKKELQQSQDEFMNQIIDEFLSCTDIPSLYYKLFERLEKIFPLLNLKKFLFCLSFTRLGMTYAEIGKVMEIPEVEVATYRYYFDEHLSEENGLLRPSNNYFHEFILKKLSDDQKVLRICNEKILLFFKNMESCPRKFDELPHFLLRNGKYSEFLHLFLSREYSEYVLSRKKKVQGEGYCDLLKEFYENLSDEEIIFQYEAIGDKNIASKMILSHSQYFEQNLSERLLNIIVKFNLPFELSDYLNARESLVWNYILHREYCKASTLLQNIIEDQIRTIGAWSEETIKTINLLLESYEYQGKKDESDRALKRFIDTLMGERGILPPYTPDDLLELEQGLFEMIRNGEGFFLRVKLFISNNSKKEYC